MRSPSEFGPRLGFVAVLSVATAGCASYAPLPLDTTSQPKHSVRELSSSFDPDKPLGADDVARLAVENNPDLKAARADRGIAEAQILRAGLLPNPQISGGYGFLLGGPGTTDSWTAAISEDIKALITLSATKSAARYEGFKVDADLLWQEWQVIGKARLLYVDIVEGRKLAQLLAEARDLFAARYRRGQQALAQGNVDLTAAAPDLTALTDIQKQIAELDRQQQTRRADLDALLNLSPEATLTLDQQIDLPSIDLSSIDDLLRELPNRRPDLIALQLGYHSQEEKFRGAILAQFPALTFGGILGSDTSNVMSGGPQLTLELPIFNHNQGNVSIERATRQKLHDEYSNRVAAAIGEVRTSVAEQVLVARQLAARRDHLAEAERIANHADAAFRAGNLDERGYVDLAMTRIATQEDIVALEQALFEQRVALATLVGAGMPAVKSPEIDQGPKS